MRVYIDDRKPIWGVVLKTTKNIKKLEQVLAHPGSAL